MAKVTMLTGILLTTLGVLCYVFWKELGANKQSPTALIPAFVGVPLMLLGWFSLLKPELRKHFMHAAVTLALLGFLASFVRFVSVLARNPHPGLGLGATLIMSILCGVYVVMCVRSFIAARRARETSAA